MDTKQVLARFEAERQALALMDHPNIAKVLDAGATESGRPFFVMELVRGIRITEYCDQNNLSADTRLDLFVQVCRAVQHAHQKGIIHRDIKPSNILVTLHDGVPVPKLIDFGIAKATCGQELTDKTLFTAVEQFIGTPAYMSPEQAEMTGLDIDTRTDIYSLGVLLYELLTGNTPFDARRLAIAALDERRRIIREEDPPSPSARLSTLDATEQTTVAKHRRSEPPKLLHLVRGDLDWIVMRALEKDRTRRYPSASELAMDIGRFLSHEPVLARPPGRLYRFGKLVRRNKAIFAAASAVTLALLVGLGLSTWMFFRERRAAKAARDLAAQNRLSSEIMGGVFSEIWRFPNIRPGGAGSGTSAPSGGIPPAGQIRRGPWFAMDNALQRVAEAQSQKEAKARVLAIQGKGLLQVADIPAAETKQREALSLRHEVFGNRHPDVSESLSLLGEVLWHKGDVDNAELSYRKALELESWKPWVTSPSILESSLYCYANVLHQRHKDAEAEKFFDNVFARAGRDISQNAVLLRARGVFYAKSGRWREASEDLSRAIKASPLNPTYWYHYGILLVQMENYPEFEKLCRHVLDSTGANCDETTARRNAKTCLLAPVPAAELSRISVMAERSSQSAGPDAALVKGWVQYRLGKYPEATTNIDAALQERRIASLTQNDPDLRTAGFLLLAMINNRLNQLEQARANLAEGRKLAMEHSARSARGPIETDDRFWAESLTYSLLLREASRQIEGTVGSAKK
jgi:tetratricopeptide (TPR) repeat protein